MLNIFPSLLVFSFFAPTLLRFAAALVFFYLAAKHYRARKEAAQEISVLSHEVAAGALGLYVLVEAAVAVCLLFGFWTQMAALVGCILCIKILFLKRSLHHLAPLSRIAYVLLAVVCFSLLLSGAGALAVDVRL